MSHNQTHEFIRAMLSHIPFDGWTDSAIALAADELGYDEARVAGLLPGGVADAIDGFVDMSDHDMAAAFAALDEKPRGITVTIKTLILIRLEAARPHREAVAEALKWLARPDHAPMATRILGRSVDRMWRLTGDKAVDFSFYTKRAILAGVYSACLAYWLANPAADAERMAEFVDARLRNALMIPKLAAPARKLAGGGARLMGRMASRFAPPWAKHS